jgi:hypothetical protein
MTRHRGTSSSSRRVGPRGVSGGVTLREFIDAIEPQHRSRAKNTLPSAFSSKMDPAVDQLRAKLAAGPLAATHPNRKTVATPAHGVFTTRPAASKTR